MDRQILSILKQSVWPSSVVPSQRTEDGLTTDRQILSILKQSVWPSSVVDGQTNSINFETICLAVEHRSEPAASGLHFLLKGEYIQTKPKPKPKAIEH
jgi:hypothetical protein